MLSFQFLSNCLGRSAVSPHDSDDDDDDDGEKDTDDDGDYAEEEVENDEFDDTLNIWMLVITNRELMTLMNFRMLLVLVISYPLLY